MIVLKYAKYFLISIQVRFF